MSDSAEAAIWLADYALQAATLNVKELNFHGGVGFAWVFLRLSPFKSMLIPFYQRYNLIQAVEYVDEYTKETRQPHIQGAYYGALMANEFIGYGDNVHVAELPTFNTRIAAYGAWESDQLRRILVLNSNSFNSTANATRTFETIDLKGLKADNRQFSVKRFYAPQTNSTQGL